MSELDRASFILRRLYPGFTEAQLERVRGELARRERSRSGAGSPEFTTAVMLARIEVRARAQTDR